MKGSALESVIPEAKLKAVEAALQQAFHTTTVDDIVYLTGGLSSALVYKIVVGGRPYVLRLIMQVDAMSDPVRQYACMNIAADAGIAPPVRYADAEQALAITDYVETTSFSGHFAAREDLLRELVRTIKALHATPLFPPLVGFLDGVDIFIQQYKALDLLPEATTTEHFARYAEIQRAYPRHDPDLVSSHNDLHPNNMLFDGKKLWLIDWEAAFRNDRYVDLAIASRSYVANKDQETFFLKAYFGETLDDYKRARFFLMQQVVHMYYAMIMLKFAGATRPAGVAVDTGMDTPRLRDFHRQVGSGEVSLATYEGKLLYGKVLLNEALRNMKTPAFREAVRTTEARR